MEREAYAAARTVSPRVRAYFERHRAEAVRRGHDRLAPLPDNEAIEALVDTAFWASLRREEGYTPKISLAFLSPEQAPDPLVFERPLPLVSAALTKVAPAVERAGIHLGVSPNGKGELSVWGTTRLIPRLCFVLEVAAPGLLVVKHHGGEEMGKFVNVAVLQGDQIKFTDEHPSNEKGCQRILGFNSLASWAYSGSILAKLAVSMRNHGHGGCLLLVPPECDTWRESIVQPISYAASPPFGALTQLSNEKPDPQRRRLWQEELNRTIEWIAGLTAVDGAMVLTSTYEMLAFGAKIGLKLGSAQVPRVTVTEPVQGVKPVVVHPERLGGTRHLSAAQFVHDQRDTVAMVASQDGRFTILEWSARKRMVHAHRVEALLL